MGRRLDDRFRECDGCGAATGLADHKPPRLCEGCEREALWAVSGDLIRHIPTGAEGICATDTPYVDITVVAAGEIATWPLHETERIP